MILHTIISQHDIFADIKQNPRSKQVKPRIETDLKHYIVQNGAMPQAKPPKAVRISM
jgi:hypothetical protein